jgi:hypothetical protein
MKNKSPLMIGALLPPPPKRPSDKQMVKEHARSTKRRATEAWVSGRMSTKEHTAAHQRADHILDGKEPKTFRGRRSPKAGDGAHNLTGTIDAGL